MGGYQAALQQAEEQFHADRQAGSGDSALENEAMVVEVEAGDDGLAEATGAHEGREGSGADTDDGGRLYTGQQGGHGQRQLHLPQALALGQAHAGGDLFQKWIDAEQAGEGIAHYR